MARYGVTKQDVYEAASQLMGQGKTPTIEHIRQILQTGSHSTIASHLRDWRATHSHAQTVALNEGLPQEMVSMMKGLWERVNAQAEYTTQQALAEMQKELQKYKHNNRRWQKLFHKWQHERESLITNKYMLEARLEALETEKIELQISLTAHTAKLAEKQTRIEELHRLFEHIEVG